MPRTTVTAVKQIVKTALEDVQIIAFLTDANIWVTEELGASGLSNERMEVIERWLACAFVRVRDLGLKSTSLKDISESYQVDASVTEYLTYAAAMDPTDKVRRAFLEKAKAGGASSGYPLIAQTGTGFAESSGT